MKNRYIEELDIAFVGDSAIPTLDAVKQIALMVNSLTVANATNRHIGTGSKLRVYERGILIDEHELFTPGFKGPLTFKSLFPIASTIFLQFITLIWAISQSKKHHDLLIADYVLSAVGGLLLRKLGKVDYVALWIKDYFAMPDSRLERFILKFGYNPLLKFCLNRIDVLYYISPRIKDALAEEGYLTRQIPSFFVPNTIDEFCIRPDYDPYAIGFVGNLHESQGVQLLLLAIPLIVKDLPKVSLRIIGTGPYEEILKDKVAKLNLDESIKFYGYVENGSDIDKILGTCAVAVAPFVPGESNYSNYADPGKVKAYMKYGLPIIMTDVSYLAEEINESGAGFIVKYEEQDLADTLIKLLGNDLQIAKCKDAMARLSGRYDTKLVVSGFLKDTFAVLRDI